MLTITDIGILSSAFWFNAVLRHVGCVSIGEKGCSRREGRGKRGGRG